MTFDTVLVANRGEIALRVMRACKELGLKTIAVYSEVDRDALHVRYADEAYLIGPPPATQSYLLGDTIIAVAKQAGAGAIHPGYGFLAENAHFAQACIDAGLEFIGPPPSAMHQMGGKIPSRHVATQAHVPLVPGTLEAVQTWEEALRIGEQFNFPIAIKASAGGGGRGLKVVYAANEVQAAFESARREAQAAFNNSELFIEMYLHNPRHMEIQILADKYGNVVYLGERDCSVQRRHQKVIEEAPSPGITPKLRSEMGSASVRLCREVGYVGVGTLEFLVSEGRFYFLEMNTRIQVEHTITEMITGIDLVQAQLRVAQGEKLWFGQNDVQFNGHAIECRINAEDAAAGFRPALGTISKYNEPRGYGVRVETGVETGTTIPPFYDSMLAKLITWGATREEARTRMLRALDDYVIEGVTTIIPFHKMALQEPAFKSGDVNVGFIPTYLEAKLKDLPVAPPVLPNATDEVPSRKFDIEINGRKFSVRVSGDDIAPSDINQRAGTPVRRMSKKAGAVTDPNAVICPIQGTVAAIKTQVGAEVKQGQVLVVVEAMKMENEISAPRDGVVTAINTEVGKSVEPGAIMVTLQE